MQVSDDGIGKQVGALRRIAGRYEFICPEYGLIVRGHYLEWVLEAASEIVGKTEKLKSEGSIDELAILAEFDDNVSSVDIDAAKYEARARFNAVPQCVVSMGDNDYRWIHREGRNGGCSEFGERLHDQSLTREPGNWLCDEQS